VGGRAGVDDHRPAFRYVVDRLGRDPQLFLRVHGLAGIDHRLVVHPLDGHRAAVDSAHELTALHVGEVPADRLRGYAEAASQVRNVNRAVAQREHVNGVLTVVLQSGTGWL
jgi:hypothetical protein